MDTKNLTTDQKVDKILELLVGNDLDQTDKGLVGQLRDTRERVFKLIAWKERSVSWLIGVSFGGGISITLIVTVIVYMIKK
jgi:hypothetical protein